MTALDDEGLTRLKQCLGSRIGPARAADLSVRLTDGRVVLVATSVAFDVNANGEGAASRFVLGVDEATRSIRLAEAAEPVTGSVLDFVLGPVERIAILADGSLRDVAVLFEAHERPWLTERTATGTSVSRRGDPRPVQMLVAVEATVASPLWISRDETRIAELIDGYELNERVELRA